ncbi:alpha-mannosidase [Herbiconiux moechotypicola]|uniref:Glycoside hydrolase family 38 central domain-containing protein n=1 Tax=Herbiconiux moechotypicola TaxID=637393 RepID=A0ABN3E2L8_9MICO|nr:alpha-mannosidase [Herbiconiux moechotypicola]MCS5731542.1 alpha-mannosidase [Herbiconiux moechotypicola]
MIGNAHIDPVWLWPWQEGYQEARATFQSAIDRMDEYDDFIFTCDQMVLLSWVEESDPVLFARIRQRVEEGRWVNVGGWWVEPDCNMPMGESFARQGLYGQRYLQSRFGRPATFAMNVDPFGHNAMLPQILRSQGMTGYAFLRPGPHEKTLPGSVFWWESPDGSRVLACRIPYEYQSSGGEIDEQAQRSIGQLEPELHDVMVFFGVGNHGGGPTKANIESIYRFDRMGSFGSMKMSSPPQFFDEFSARAGREGLDSLPVWRGDLQHHAPGCYSSHSGIKLWQRKAQATVLSAERWAAVVTITTGVDYPKADLENAWKQVLFNQFHDVLPGSALETAYDDARDQLGEAISIAKRIITRSQNIIARQIDIPLEPSHQPVVVFNPHPWPTTSVLDLQYQTGARPDGMHMVDAAGRPVPSQNVRALSVGDEGRGAIAFQSDLPAFGYRLYYLRGGAAPAGAAWGDASPQPLHSSEHTLENRHLRLTLDPDTGWLSSLVDKRSGADLAANALGDHHTQICQDPTDTWGHRVVSYNWPGVPLRTDRISLRESGPLRSRIRVERSWGRSTMIEDFILGHDSDQVEVRVTIDWRERAHMLKLRFPVAVSDPTATFEIPFGTLERPVNGSEEPGQSWVDLTGDTEAHGRVGLAVVNNAKHGYDASPARVLDDGRVESASIGITAVRSPVYSWHDPRLLDPEESYSYQDQGVQTFTYLLVPHGADWREADLTRRAALLGSAPRAMMESFHEGPLRPSASFASDRGGSVMITAIKGSEDDGVDGTDLIVRAVETSGSATTVELDLPLVGRTLTAEFAAHQIRTWRIPRDPESPAVEVDLVEWPVPTTIVP